MTAPLPHKEAESFFLEAVHFLLDSLCIFGNIARSFGLPLEGTAQSQWGLSTALYSEQPQDRLSIHQRAGLVQLVEDLGLRGDAQHVVNSG